MICQELPYGQVRFTRCVPTLPALRYLNCCTIAGWHCCNSTYCPEYKDGVNELLLIYTVDGSGILEMDNHAYTLCRDSVILVPPHTPMKYFTDSQIGSWEFYWLDLTGERALSVAEKLWQDGYCLFRGITSIEHIFEDLLSESFSEVECSALIGELLDRIVSEAIFGEKASAVNRILKYISEHYTERVDLRRMSELFFFSQNQIIRIVRARTGYTPHEYLIRLRLAKACEFLQYSAMPIGEIGRSVGYDNNSHFSAAFRRLYGISPIEYRSHFSK